MGEAFDASAARLGCSTRSFHPINFRVAKSVLALQRRRSDECNKYFHNKNHYKIIKFNHFVYCLLIAQETNMLLHMEEEWETEPVKLLFT